MRLSFRNEGGRRSYHKNKFQHHQTDRTRQDTVITETVTPFKLVALALLPASKTNTYACCITTQLCSFKNERSADCHIVYNDNYYSFNESLPPESKLIPNRKALREGQHDSVRNVAFFFVKISCGFVTQQSSAVL